METEINNTQNENDEILEANETRGEQKRIKGRVFWFNPKFGYGFINNHNVNNDIFIHYSNIEINGYKILFKNDMVIFDYDEDKKRALKVTLIKKSFERKKYYKEVI